MLFIFGTILGLGIFLIIGLIVIGLKDKSPEYLLASTVGLILLFIATVIIHSITSEKEKLKACLEKGLYTVKIENANFCRIK